jgi:hypothetical protein
MLQPAGPTRGVVVRLVGGVAEIATDKGMVRVQAATALQPGQRVRISGGAAYPAAVAAVKYAL